MGRTILSETGCRRNAIRNCGRDQRDQWLNCKKLKLYIHTHTHFCREGKIQEKRNHRPSEGPEREVNVHRGAVPQIGEVLSK